MPTLKEESDLKKCIIFLLVTTISLLSTSMAWANLSPETLPTTGKFNNSHSQTLIGKNDPSSQKISPTIRKYDPWPQNPPKIGRLELKQEYWNYMKEAARKYQISPYLIQAVCAIESRYDPYATSGRGQCIGLMQLHRGTAKKYEVDPWNPRENIMGGAAVLANLLSKYNGDLRRVLHVYNATCTAAYEREVIKALNAAIRNGTASYQVAKWRY
jgi:soluble lytic murein transglycosylase-like protein